MAKILEALVSLAVLLAPITAAGYLLPEDVLMGNDTYIPPANRDTRDRVLKQSADSAQRRQKEWEEEYARQHPEPPPAEYGDEGIELEEREGSPAVESSDMELLRTIRLLNRIDENQQTIRHEGAPPLAPTGAPAVISAIIMIGAVGWTLWRAGKKRGWTEKV